MARRFIKKVCMLGDPGVGKTSLIRRFVYEEFDDEYLETIGTKITRKEVLVNKDNDQANVVLMIWDIVGHKSPKAVPPSYYAGAEGVLVVCDLTRKETYDELDYWVDLLSAMTDNIPIIFIGNKNDLKDSLQVSDEMMQKLSASKDRRYFYTSAKSGENVESVFKEMADMIVEL
jgi:small GTP-binding protein